MCASLGALQLGFKPGVKEREEVLECRRRLDASLPMAVELRCALCFGSWECFQCALCMLVVNQATSSIKPHCTWHPVAET